MPVPHVPSDAELDAAAGDLAGARAALDAAVVHRAQVIATLKALGAYAVNAAEKLALEIALGMIERELGRKPEP